MVRTHRWRARLQRKMWRPPVRLLAPVDSGPTRAQGLAWKSPHTDYTLRWRSVKLNPTWSPTVMSNAAVAEHVVGWQSSHTYIYMRAMSRLTGEEQGDLTPGAATIEGLSASRTGV